MDQAKSAILQAALGHAPFDGWSEATLTAALADSGVAPALGRALFPRGGIDLAVAYHRMGDRAMAATLAAADLSALRSPRRPRWAWEMMMLSGVQSSCAASAVNCACCAKADSSLAKVASSVVAASVLILAFDYVLTEMFFAR